MPRFAKIATWTLPLLSGALGGLAQANETGAFLSFFALVPLFLFWHYAPSPLSALVGGWSAASIALAIETTWLFELLPIPWMPAVSAASAAIFMLFAWSLTSLFMGAPFALVSVLAYKAIQRNIRWWPLFALALWIAAEYASSWIPAALWVGAETSIHPITFGNIGYALANFPALLSLSRWGSIYILSSTLFAVNWFVFLIYRRFLGQPRKATLAVLATAVAISLIPSLPGPSSSSHQGQLAPTTIALVSSNIPSWAEATQTDKQIIKENLGLALAKLARENVDAVIFPESAHVLNLFDKTFLESLFKNGRTIIIDNSVVRDPRAEGSLRSRLFAYEPASGNVVASWDKSFLFFGGEYPPLLLTSWARFFGFNEVLRRYAATSYSPGEGNERPVPIGSHFAAISLCTQSWAPQFFLNQTRMGADLLINLSSDALFHGAKFYLWERLLMLKVRAAENGAYLLHAANGSSSLVIDPTGKIPESLEARERLTEKAR